MSRPTSPSPTDNFILRVAGKMRHCDECGGNMFHQLPPRGGVARFGCNRCNAAYLLVGDDKPILMEN